MVRNEMNRRDVLRAAGAVAVGVASGAFPTGWVRAEDNATKKVLFFTKSAGFEHDAIKADDNPHHGFAVRTMQELAKAHGFDVTVTKDGSIFTPDKLAQFDVVAFYTTGDLDHEGTDKQPAMPEGGKQALIDFVAGGKGFVGFHCASDTFDHHGDGPKTDPYIRMLGGEFVTHGGQQPAEIKVVDPNFIKGLQDFKLTEEWYRLKNFAPDLHVICVQQTDSMAEDQYKKDGPYPETWARMHEKGRVFYTSMGHREDVWQNESFQKVLLGGLAWAAKNVDADVTPNIDKVTPEALNRLGK